MGGRYTVPEGWFNYSAFGKPVKNTQIIPVKTPLKKEFNSGLKKVECPENDTIYKKGVPVEEEFTPSQLVARIDKELGRKLGAVIDLTNTSRYYNFKDFLDLGLQYMKIKCPGQEIPSDDIYARFKIALSEFLENCDKDSLIAVHCTHGLNRTGYLVCRFLIEDGLDPEKAIKDFNDARGYSIERENYLKHLRDGCPKSTNTPSREPYECGQPGRTVAATNHLLSDPTGLDSCFSHRRSHSSVISSDPHIQQSHPVHILRRSGYGNTYQPAGNYPAPYFREPYLGYEQSQHNYHEQHRHRNYYHEQHRHRNYYHEQHRHRNYHWRTHQYYSPYR